MPRSYRHIKQYEKEILELRKQGLTHREIGEKYGLRKEQIKDFLKQSKKREEKIKAGKAIETGFTIDVVKKVSQLKKIYSKIEEQIKDKLLLDRLYSLKFKAIELKKIADAKELLEEFLESSYTGMKTSEIKLKVNELVSRKERLGIAKDEYLSKKQKLEEDELRIKELIKE